MLDIQALRNDLEGVKARLATRGFVLDAARFQELEAQRKTIQTRSEAKAKAMYRPSWRKLRHWAMSSSKQKCSWTKCRLHCSSCWK